MLWSKKFLPKTCQWFHHYLVANRRFYGQIKKPMIRFNTMTRQLSPCPSDALDSSIADRMQDVKLKSAAYLLHKLPQSSVCMWHIWHNYCYQLDISWCIRPAVAVETILVSQQHWEYHLPCLWIDTRRRTIIKLNNILLFPWWWCGLLLKWGDES